MKIKVFAPTFCDVSKMENGYLEISENTTVSEVFDMLNMEDKLKKILISLVNYERVKLSHKLMDGDILNIIGPVNGG
jgi:molybdopterin converting factor small subunit